MRCTINLVTAQVDAFVELRVEAARLREVLRERKQASDGKRDQRQRGRYLGGTAPFGFRADADGTLVPDARQQAAIARIHELRAEGLSLRRLADQMAAEGMPISLPTMMKVLRAGDEP